MDMSPAAIPEAELESKPEVSSKVEEKLPDKQSGPKKSTPDPPGDEYRFDGIGINLQSPQKKTHTLSCYHLD
jgi:hypothetical protein